MKFPVSHWQEPQPRNGEGPTSAKVPHAGPSPRESVPPEEEPPAAARHVSTAAAAGPQLVLGFWVPVCLPGELARPSSFSSSTFRKGAESASLLPFSKLNRNCSDRRRGLSVEAQVRCQWNVLCRLGQFCSLELSAATEMFRACAFQHSKPLTTGSSRRLEMSCNRGM